MHQDIAEMDHITAPALLAYRGGDVFATIVDVLRNIPRGRSCSADSLEDLLKLCVFPSSCSFPTGPYANSWRLQTPCAMILSLLLCFQPSTFTGIAARRLGCSLVISALFDLTRLSFFFYSLLRLSLSLISLMDALLHGKPRTYLETALFTRMGCMDLDSVDR